MGLARFRAHLDGPAIGLDVNDEPVPAVRAMALQVARGQVPRLILELDADGVLEGEGIVEVRREEAAAGVDAGPAVAAWLANIDAEELSKAAMERMDWGEDADVVVQALAVLRSWALGEVP